MRVFQAIAGLFFLVSLLLLTLIGAAVFGFFSPHVVLGILSAGVIGWALWVRFFATQHKHIYHVRWDIVALIFAAALALFTALYQHDLPRGRDDMGILTAAVQLTESGSLSFIDPLSAPFHPYREIAPDEYTSQFLPGYTAVLAAGMHFGGIDAGAAVNGILIFLTLLVLYMVGVEAHSRIVGASFMVFFASSYLFFWIPRRTLSENLFIFLIWTAAYALLRAYRERSGTWLLLGTLPLAVGLLTRIEGVLYLGAYAVAALLLAYVRRKDFSFYAPALLWLLPLAASGVLLWRYTAFYGADYLQDSYGHLVTSSTWLPLLGVGIVALFLFFVGATLLQRYHIAARKTAKLFIFVLIAFELFLLFWWLPGQNEISWSILKSHYVLQSFVPYFLLPFAVLALIGYVRGSFHSRLFWVVFFLSPALFFVWDPLIALDQPWYMRRYYPVFIPFLYLAGSIGLVDLLKRSHFIQWGVIGVLVLVQVMIFYPLVTYQDHEGVRAPLEEFAASFPDRALVLMEPGWGWQQWAYALHYVYDIDVLPNLDNLTPEKLDALFASHDDMYVVSTQPETYFLGIPDAALTYERTVTFSYPELESTTNLNTYLNEHEQLDVNFIAWSLQQNPPLTISTVEQEWGVYHLTDTSALNAPVIFSIRNSLTTE
ncbi:MAG: hypothetical protein WCV86_03025 [Patescibacteria group bacterium]|jgi:hypothetical protein